MPSEPPATPAPADAATAAELAADVEAAAGAGLGTFRTWVVSRPVVAVWFATAMFSLGPVLVAAASTSGTVFSFWRLWFGGIFVSAVALLSRRRSRRAGAPIALTRQGVVATLAAGVAFAIHQVMFMAALRSTSVVDVTLMNTLAPLIVAILAVPLFGERPGVAFRLWSVLAIAGAAAVAVAGSTGPQGNPVGMALGAGNVVFYSLFFVWSKRVRDHIDPITFVAGFTTIAAIAVSLFALATGTAVGAISAHDLLLCAALAVVPGFIGHLSMTWSVKWVPANVPPVVMLAIPIFSGALAWILLGQATTWLKVVAGAVTLVGVGGAVRSSAVAGTRAATAEHAPLAVEALALANET